MKDHTCFVVEELGADQQFHSQGGEVEVEQCGEEVEAGQGGMSIQVAGKLSVDNVEEEEDAAGDSIEIVPDNVAVELAGGTVVVVVVVAVVVDIHTAAAPLSVSVGPIVQLSEPSLMDL